MEWEERIVDTETPISIYLKLRKLGLNVPYLLESATSIEKWGRYSFLGFGEPKIKIKYFIEKEELEIYEEGKKTIKKTKKPLQDIKEFIKIKNIKGVERAPYGLQGYISYDIFSTIEDVKTWEGKEVLIDFPDIYLIFVEKIFIYDNFLKRGIANFKIDEILKTKIDDSIKEVKNLEFKNLVSQKEFENMVLKAKERIVNGDIIQVVLSRPILGERELDEDEILSIYRMLRIKNPSPYMYLINFGDIKIIGTSPEVLVRLENGKVETRPIAGTRRRGKDEEEDALLEKSLLEDEKELAEHIMLVDLARNDLGRICIPGTVKVTRKMDIEKYSDVMHIVSDVSGITNASHIDVFSACFPAGTVVGAPKISASKIIAELEKYKRGPYAGAIGYFGKGMDTAILIRTIFIKDDKILIQAGAGIVYDSIPENEYLETEYKMKALYEIFNKK